MTMTLKNKLPDFGPPAPITELTMEQDLKMRLLDDALNSTYDTNREDIITVFLALQKQNFIMANSIRNLIEKWPKALPLLIQK